LLNASRHARAATVHVTLASRDGGVWARVEDDGTGFDPSAVATVPGHVGLAGMRERAEIAGGRLEIDTAPGRGTVVTFWVPADGRGRPPA
jgi:signal transduction histidine kinase